jgi:hypothetical protein
MQTSPRKERHLAGQATHPSRNFPRTSPMHWREYQEGFTWLGCWHRAPTCRPLPPPPRSRPNTREVKAASSKRGLTWSGCWHRAPPRRPAPPPLPRPRRSRSPPQRPGCCAGWHRCALLRAVARQQSPRAARCQCLQPGQQGGQRWAMHSELQGTALCPASRSMSARVAAKPLAPPARKAHSCWPGLDHKEAASAGRSAGAATAGGQAIRGW